MTISGLILFVVLAAATPVFASATTKTEYLEAVHLLQERGFAGVDQALTRFEDIVNRQPDFHPARMAAANAYLLKYEFSENKDADWLNQAEQHLNQVIEGGTEPAEAYFKRALVSLNRNQAEQAEQDLLQALSLRPSYPEAHIVYLRFLLAHDRQSEARQNAPGWLNASTNKAETARSFGELFAAAEDHETAAALYQQVLSAKPNDPHVLAALGNSSLHLGRYEEAADALAAAVEQLPEHLQIRFALGVCLSELDRPKAAVEQFELYRKSYPDDVSALNNLAVLYEKTGQTARAKLMWLKVKDLAQDPGHQQRAENNLLRLLHSDPKSPPQREPVLTPEDAKP